jgi:nicotinate-nucleotide adenylyltransferase
VKSAGGGGGLPTTAIFGGTFDPIHLAHLVLAEQVGEAVGLETVVFVPAGRPPHKDGGTSAPPHHRLAMVELAVTGNRRFTVSGIELEAPGPSFTIDTVRRLKAAGAGRIALIIGGDSLVEMSTWREPEALLAECDLLVVERPGYDLERAPAAYRKQARVVPALKLDIASRAIRARVTAGKSIRYLVPEPVRAYIEHHGLYRNGQGTGDTAHDG